MEARTVRRLTNRAAPSRAVLAVKAMRMMPTCTTSARRARRPTRCGWRDGHRQPGGRRSASAPASTSRRPSTPTALRPGPTSATSSGRSPARADPGRRSSAAVPARTSRPRAGRLVAASRLISCKSDSSEQLNLGAPQRKGEPGRRRRRRWPGACRGPDRRGAHGRRTRRVRVRQALLRVGPRAAPVGGS